MEISSPERGKLGLASARAQLGSFRITHAHTLLPKLIHMNALRDNTLSGLESDSL